MISAQNLIIASLVDLGFAPGETPAPEELNDGLLKLQALIASWSAQALPIPQITERQIILTGVGKYSVTPRPMKIKSAFVSGVGLVIPVHLATAEEWASGAGTASTPAAYYDGGYPAANVQIRPVTNSGILFLEVYDPLAVVASLGDPINLPPGYDRALITGLSLELAPQYGRSVDQIAIIKELATDAKISIAGLNAATLGQPVPIAPQQQQAAA